MSDFTTQVRYICEYAAGLTSSAGFSQIDGILDIAAPIIFNFDYPIFDESYRIPLEKKILRHFYTREICEETVGLWQLRLCDKMNVIMPYYNQLYESALIKIEPLLTTDYTRTGNNHAQTESSNSEQSTMATHDKNVVDTSNVAESTGDNGTESTNWRLFSNTPQGAISRVDIANNAYLTDATKTSDEATTTTSEHSSGTSNETSDYNRNGSSQRNNTNTGNSTTDYYERIAGKMGSRSQSAMLKEFRETFLNIDSMILDELSTLFFHLYC
ncbi:MAG: hypothetical protein J6Q48_05860 [Bacteroidaceae bacterium]|nr:hypothetical protein [Bacteroidaceae bacterium]